MEKTVRGCYYGSCRPRQDMPRIAEWYTRGLLDIDGLITRQYTLAEINRAYQELETDAVGRGVIVF
jgi:Zn-dependent alcohol dehydrogenase